MNAIDKPVAAKPVAVGSSKILAALHTVMASCGYVQKKGTNAFQQYKYAGEAHVLEALRPAMLEAGLLLIPSGKFKSPIDEHGITHVEVEYTLAHKDGEVWPEKIIAYGDGADKNSKGVGDKGLYKALTGANKYLLFKLFQLETGDDPEKDDSGDRDGEAPAQAGTPERKLTKPQARPEYDKLINEIKACGDVSTLATWGARNKPRLDAMPADWQVSLRDEYASHKSTLNGVHQ